MRKPTVLVILGCLAASLAGGPASAQENGHGTGIGVGVELMNTGLVGGTVTYDAGRFHVSAIMGAADIESYYTDIAFGGRFYLQVHSSQAADFSVGAGLALDIVDFDDGPDALDVHLEAGAKIRAFIVPNVALSLSAGLGIVFRDDENVINDQTTVTVGAPAQTGLVGAAGLTYFFY